MGYYFGAIQAHLAPLSCPPPRWRGRLPRASAMPFTKMAPHIPLPPHIQLPTPKMAAAASSLLSNALHQNGASHATPPHSCPLPRWRGQLHQGGESIRFRQRCGSRRARRGGGRGVKMADLEDRVSDEEKVGRSRGFPSCARIASGGGLSRGRAPLRSCGTSSPKNRYKTNEGINPVPRPGARAASGSARSGPETRFDPLSTPLVFHFSKQRATNTSPCPGAADGVSGFMLGTSPQTQRKRRALFLVCKLVSTSPAEQRPRQPHLGLVHGSLAGWITHCHSPTDAKGKRATQGEASSLFRPRFQLSWISRPNRWQAKEPLLHFRCEMQRLAWSQLCGRVRGSPACCRNERWVEISPLFKPAQSPSARRRVLPMVPRRAP